MNNIVFSIIVPVWNSSQSLDKCINSIMSQTMTNWELILSDDGSLDQSLSICQSYARNDDRIIVCSNQHKGVANARNAAIKLACGKYICFVDSDDVIDPDYLCCLYNHCAYDVVLCGYYVDIYDKDIVLRQQHLHTLPERGYNLSQKDDLKLLFSSGFMHMNWNKLFKKSIIDKYNIEYKSYSVNEDFIFLMDYIFHCKNLYVTSKASYHWNRVEGIQSGVESLPDDLLKIYNEAHTLLQRFFENDENIADEIMYYSYELIAIKYMRANNTGLLNTNLCKSRLKEFHCNALVKRSFSAHHPRSIGESLFYWLLRLGFYKTYYLVSSIVR